MTLTQQWQEIRPAQPVQATAEWSEILVEVPLAKINTTSDRVIAPDGTDRHVEGYLVIDDQRRVDLLKAKAVSYDGSTFVRLSSDELEWHRPGFHVSSLWLRSDKTLPVRRIIWMSYDPRDTKAGVKHPRSLIP